MYKKDYFNTDKPIQTYKSNFIRETEVYVSPALYTNGTAFHLK